MATISNDNKSKKKFQTDLLKIGGTALITAALFVLYNRFSPNSTSSTDYGVHMLGSGRIPLAEAIRLRKNWIDTPLIRTDSSGHSGALQAFRFKADQLDTIINYNASLDSGVKADDIIFYFGRDGDTAMGTGPGARKFVKMRLIAIGLKNDSLLITDKHTNTAGAFVPSVYDKAVPCPPKCPKGF